MSNPKKDIYNAIKARILDQVQEIKHVLLFNNQFEKDNQEEAFLYPNAFIEFSQLLSTGTTQQVQNVDMNVTIYMGFERYETESLTIFDTIQSVYIALQGFSGACFSGLQRIEEVQDTDHDNVIIWKTIFSTTATDAEAHPSNKLVEANVTNLNITSDLDIDNDVIRTGDGVF